MLFDRNFEGKHDASFSVPHYSIAKWLQNYSNFVNVKKHLTWGLCMHWK